MKKFMTMLAVFCTICIQAQAFIGRDKPISTNQLPTSAQQVIKKHFAGQRVALAKEDSDVFGKSYDVIFANGDKIEFDRHGNWKEVECNYSQVPAALVPTAISKYVRDNYPQTRILEISRDRRGYDVKLSNRIELEFNIKCQLIDIDD